MKIVFEQCLLFDGVKFVKAFIGDPKIELSYVSVSMEVFSLNPPMVRLTCANPRGGEWATTDIMLKSADSLGTFPLFDVRALAETIRTLGATSEVTLEDKNGKVKCSYLHKSGRKQHSNFSLILGEQLPIPNMKVYGDVPIQIAEIKGETLNDIILKADSMIKSSDNLVFNTVQLVIHPNIVSYVCMDDSSRLALKGGIAGEYKGGLGKHFYCASAKKITQFMANSGNVKITSNDNMILFEQGSKKTYMSLLAKPFIDIFLNDMGKTIQQYSIDKSELLDAAYRVKAVCDRSAMSKRHCCLSFDDKCCVVSTSDVRGDNESVLDYTSSNKQLFHTFTFSVDALIKASNMFYDGTIELRIMGKDNYINTMLYQQIGNEEVIQIYLPRYSNASGN